MEIEIQRSEIRNAIIPSVKVIELADLDDTASLHCPNCDALISPDDARDEVYTIIDFIFDGDLQGVMISCQCGQQIFLDLQPIPCFPSVLDILGR